MAIAVGTSSNSVVNVTFGHEGLGSTLEISPNLVPIVSTGRLKAHVRKPAAAIVVIMPGKRGRCFRWYKMKASDAAAIKIAHSLIVSSAAQEASNLGKNAAGSWAMRKPRSSFI